VHSYLIDPAYIKKYLINVFPDSIFKEMFLKALETDKQRMMEVYEKLVNRVMNRMGDFDIDGWKIKSPVIE